MKIERQLVNCESSVGSLLFLANSCLTGKSNIQYISINFRYDTEIKKILDVLICSSSWSFIKFLKFSF